MISRTIKIKISFLLLAFLTFSVYPQSLGQNEIKLIDSLTNQIKDTPGMTILVAKNGNVLFKKAYGYANYELKVPNKTNFSFAIGSISKQFTAVAILKLSENNKLSIKDKVKTHLPWFNTKRENDITIEHLLTHTIGAKDFFTNNDFVDYFVKPFSKDIMLEYLAKEISFESNPGTTYKYSNAGYVYLSLIIERVSGVSYDTYIEENIFKPLKMNSSFVGSPNKLVFGTVTGYNTSRDEHKNIIRESYLHQNLNWVNGAGTIYSSVEDMLKWDEALYTNKIIGLEYIKSAQSSFTLNNGLKTEYGYGFEIANNNETKIITHSGMINGFQANMIRIPKHRIYIIGLSNRIDFPPSFIYNIAKRMMN